MKDSLIEIKNNLQGNDSRVDEAEDQIYDLKYKEAKNNQSEQEEEKRIQKEQQEEKRTRRRKKNPKSISSLCNNF